MDQPPQKVSLPLSRRRAPRLHLDAGRRWMDIIDQYGYRYLGHTGHTGTVRAKPWHPEWLLATSVDGEASLFRNRCPHQGNLLLKPVERPDPNESGVTLHQRGSITCGFHAWSISARDGTVARCGHMKLSPADLPEEARRCEPSSRALLTWRGLVFELGTHADLARERLESALAFVDRQCGKLFDFERFSLRWSRSYRQRGDMVTSLVNYLDIDHVPLHGKTLATLVDTKEGYIHKESPDGSAVIQWMALNSNWLAGDEEFAKRYQRLGLPMDITWGSCWMTTDFGLMLEAYPGVRVVSQCFPDPNDPLACTFHHDFYYDPLVKGEIGREFIDHQQVLFNATGDEDEEWCANVGSYLRRLIAEGRDRETWGVINPEKENFADWYYDHVEAKLAMLRAAESGE